MDLIKYIELKKKLKKEIESKLDFSQIEKVKKDHHSRRKPRPCGMTIHTGIGCPIGCRYCYIYDMGFPGKASPYPLSGIELVYALTLNPYVVLGEGGTMFALGAVTEPFLRETKERTFEYLKVLGKLKNPIQISSKLTLSDEDCLKIREYTPHISFLMTIVAINNYKILEPNAPKPEDRIETMAKLIKHGIHVSLFLRPIIPGMSDRDANEILEICKSIGVKVIVLGTLRITKNIFKKLLSIGINLSNRITKLSDKEQIPIKGHDLKMYIRKIAEKKGFIVYDAACGANIDAYGIGCIACEMGPCGNLNKLPDVNEHDIIEFLKYQNIKFENIQVKEDKIIIKGVRNYKEILYYWLKELTRRKVMLY